MTPVRVNPDSGLSLSTSDPGGIGAQVEEWCKITSDPSILDIVQGCRFVFDQAPVQIHPPPVLRFSLEEHSALTSLIQDFCRQGVIVPTFHEEGEFISNVFLRPKKTPGKYRLILNLKPLTPFIKYEHFKMDTIHTCIDLMTMQCFMASLDLQDAYFSVPIHRDYQKYLKFCWEGVLYKYVCMPQGLACAPRIFTKLLKPIFGTLRQQGYISSGYLDDLYLQGNTFDSCADNVQTTMELLVRLGFNISDKSVTTPTQTLNHLGFILCSRTMTVALDMDKIQRLHDRAVPVLSSNVFPIRTVARLVGTMVACTVGVEYGALHYHLVEREKAEALKKSYGNFEGKMSLSPRALADVRWWLENARVTPKVILHGNPRIVLRTDASLTGWGAVIVGDLQHKTGGQWSPEESNQHINVLELTALLFGLKAFAGVLYGQHVLAQMDNVTAVAYVREMGGCRSVRCNDLAIQIWEFARSIKVWLSCTYIPGKQNTEADFQSRVFTDDKEWQLNPELFQKIENCFGGFDLDLFASRLNAQVRRYVSWRADPGAEFVDAFTIDWSSTFNYAFPPFSLLTKALQKIETDRARCVLVVPNWPTQAWFPKLLSLLVGPPRTLPICRRTLLHPITQERHPLHPRLELWACPLSGDITAGPAFRQQLRNSCWPHGLGVPNDSTTHTSTNGRNIVACGVTIPLLLL